MKINTKVVNVKDGIIVCNFLNLWETNNLLITPLFSKPRTPFAYSEKLSYYIKSHLWTKTMIF